MDAAHGQVLAPPTTKGFHSVVRLPDAWFVACSSRELRGRPIARTVQGVPLMLFRGAAGQAAAFLDRCPHRNVPLSAGRIRGDQLECAYHGWRFDADGRCRAIPGLCGPIDARARNATTYACVEQDGCVWVYTRPDLEPESLPYRLPHLDDPQYATVRRSYTVAATLHAVVENALDVPHTAFLHGGLFRTRNKDNEIDVVVRRWGDRVEAEYIGEPRPKGIAGKILAPGGGTVAHFDRFLLPCVAQVEYRLGARSHLVTTSLVTPITDFETRLYAVVTFRLPLPHWLVRPFLTPVGTHIFRQDARILRLQTETVQRFGGEQFASTEIDVLGQSILRLLLQAQRGERPPRDAPPEEHRLRMSV
ncbi:MAG TPA: aromatic ring-hydroxylating dioxygenase subunit alpha [Myxococcaceae bacterium]|jgi:phenylpropionate dioxygenase-like ring-hydroxylating dioxygenase large terminal subunit|nr:aromatic ring-hydroxylating dioxygenase subunit alpha [Myxococcaceae bacterium]